MPEENSDATLDGVHVDTLIKARKKLGDKPATSVHIFERNDFFYLFEKDGDMAAQHIYGSVTATKSMGKSEAVSFCVLNHPNFEKMLRFILLVKHLRVEIFKFIAAKGGKPPCYELEVRASPGNISAIEHVLYGDGDVVRDCNYLVGVRLQGSGDQLKVGVAAVDTSLNVIQVCDFDEVESFQNLESVLVQINPREVVLPQSDHGALKKVQQILERNRILVTAKPNADFAALNDEEVQRLFNKKSNLAAMQENPLSNAACSAVFKYLGVNEAKEEKLFRVNVLKPSEYMRIDQRTVAGLNLFDEPGRPENSVFHILNKTRTPGGSRLLQTWIKQPLIQVDAIKERLDLVENFVENSEVRQIMYEDHLRKMPDFQRLSTRFQSKKASLQDMYKVYVAVGKLGGLNEALKQFGPDSNLVGENFTKDIGEAINDFDKFLQLVESTLDLEQIRNGQFLIKPEFDESLAELRQELDAVENKVQKNLNFCASELGVEAGKVLKLEHSSIHGYYFRLTMKDEKSVRNNRSFNIIEANKSGIKFRNGKLEALNDEHSDIAGRYEKQQAAIVQEMVGIASGYADVMNHLGHIISKLDVIVSLSLAAVSAPTPYVKPTVLPPGPRKLEIVQVRHPIVELQENVSYIANDVEFLEGESTFHIITGPNMGGKSTYIRSVGVAVLMGQIGSFVPAESATFSVNDSVMVRIGASDCQVKGISTFMAEMLETVAILKSATKDSLILIDELGRGTSTYDGFGIAWAVSEHIVKEIGCFTLFTTHYTELTQLAEEIPTVKNYHVTAMITENKLTLLYQILPGVCDKSFGIHVAKLASFPPAVIEEANERLKRLESGAALTAA